MNAGPQQSARLRPFRPISFGRYTLLTPLATGGMGEIFLARFEGTSGFEKLCVIKKILSALAQDSVFVERFVGEAKILVKLSHGSIAQVFDMGLHEGEPYIALEFVDGKDLRKVAARQRDRSIPLPLTFVLFVMSRVLDALAYAHRKRDDADKEINLVHRDISPQNILISYEGEVKVIDFGLAKSALSSAKTNPSMILGKFLYMSPEQARHQKVDRRSDLYSVGICLYETISGRNPFDGVPPGEIMARVANPSFPSLREVDPLCPQAVVDVVMKSLEIDPAKRFQSAEEMRGRLLSALLEIDPSAGPESVSRYMREAFAPEHQAERKLLGALNQAKPARAAAVDGPPERSARPAEVETAVVHLKNVAPSAAAAMSLGTTPSEPQRAPRPAGPIEPAPLSFAPTPRARETGSERPEGATVPGVLIDETTRPAVAVVKDVKEVDEPQSKIETAELVQPSLSLLDVPPTPTLPPPPVSSPVFETTERKVIVPDDPAPAANPPTIEVSVEATGRMATPLASALDTQPRATLPRFQDTVPRVVLGTLLEDDVAKEDTSPRVRMVGRRETVEEPAAKPTNTHLPPVPPAPPLPQAEPKPGASGLKLALIGALGFVVFVGAALVLLPLLAGPDALPFPVPWAPKAQSEVVDAPPESELRPLSPKLAPREDIVVEVSPPKVETALPPVDAPKADARKGDEEPVDLVGLTAEEPDKKLVGPMPEEVKAPAKKVAPKRPLTRKGKQLQSEFRALAAQFEYVKNRLPCETDQMALLCTKFTNLKFEVDEARSDTEIEKALKRTRDLAARVETQKKKLR